MLYRARLSFKKTAAAGASKYGTVFDRVERTEKPGLTPGFFHLK
jgi:hypothetical protein